MAKPDRSVEILSQMFRVLGDSTRLRIWKELQAGELNVTEICQRLKAPQPTVSHHLGIMRLSGLVSNRRSGKEIYYSLSELDKDVTGKALRSMLAGAVAVRVGPIVFGLTKA